MGGFEDSCLQSVPTDCFYCFYSKAKKKGGTIKAIKKIKAIPGYFLGGLRTLVSKESPGIAFIAVICFITKEQKTWEGAIKTIKAIKAIPGYLFGGV